MNNCCIWNCLNCLTWVRKGCCFRGSNRRVGKRRRNNSGKIVKVVLFDENNTSFTDITTFLVNRKKLLHKDIHMLFPLTVGKRPMMEIEYIFNRSQYKIVYCINLHSTDMDYTYFPIYMSTYETKPKHISFNHIFFDIEYNNIELLNEYKMYQGPNNNFHLDKSDGIRKLKWKEFILLSGLDLIVGKNTIRIHNNDLEEFDYDIESEIVIDTNYTSSSDDLKN